jgi:acyl-CoA synthetase (AMP-forming)/AMP-acid ligase II
MHAWPREQQLDVKQRAGIHVPGLQLRIVDDAGHDAPHDGVAMGRLLVKGPWVAAAYDKEDPTPDKFPDGWLDTGDVATLDAEDYLAIADRAKDVVKSGGEGIASVDLETAIMAIAGVAEAAVIAVTHPTWQERPLACVVVEPGATVTTAHIDDHLGKRFATWWVPDAMVFMDAVPKTSVGKVDKKA